MKKIIILILLFVAPVIAWEQNFSGSDTSTVILERPGNAKNCLTNLTWVGSNFPSAGFTMVILDGSATAYSLHLTTGPYTQSWDANNPLCTTVNSSMTIVASQGTVRRNYTGFIKGK